ncbi:hypothetical protein [Pseudalkalibacillus caeni]|uniref:Uncharacterized protein n=1 Tax=Exobacillus caeni TaxID=2574798 RepID=A0A5R9F5K2_9BACL|nr:hypothetical protein [Pseudalkalibacillus caeni]TLS37606.1 hypothetical protein FCL54_10735 [Pseudalkalibacillus caeni]
MIFAPVVINLLGFKVNIVERNSMVNFSPVQQLDVYLSTKRNQGFGEENGDLTAVYIPISYVVDADGSDSNSIKNSVV